MHSRFPTIPRQKGIDSPLSLYSSIQLGWALSYRPDHIVQFFLAVFRKFRRNIDIFCKHFVVLSIFPHMSMSSSSTDIWMCRAIFSTLLLTHLYDYLIVIFRNKWKKTWRMGKSIFPHRFEFSSKEQWFSWLILYFFSQKKKIKIKATSSYPIFSISLSFFFCSHYLLLGVCVSTFLLFLNSVFSSSITSPSSFIFSFFPPHNDFKIIFGIGLELKIRI